MARKTAKQIVKESFPDLEVVERPAVKSAAKASDAVRKMTRPGPSMADLRAKSRASASSAKENTENSAANDPAHAQAADAEAEAESAEQPAAQDVQDEGESEDNGDEVEVIQVRRKRSRSSADPADDLGTRTVIVSRKKGVIGIQG